MTPTELKKGRALLGEFLVQTKILMENVALSTVALRRAEREYNTWLAGFGGALIDAAFERDRIRQENESIKKRFLALALTADCSLCRCTDCVPG